MNSIYWNLPPSSSGISHYRKIHAILDNAAMYFDVTREELLDLLASYEKDASLRSLAIKSGISYAALVDFKRGKSHLLGDKNLRAVMGVLRPQSVQELRIVPLVGYVGAGEQIFPIDDHAKGQGLAEIDCPHNIDHKKGVALEVRGDSMEPLISDGFLLFYEERFHGVPAEYINRICVVWIEGDGCLVKKIRKGTKPGYYTLESLNNSTKPIENARVAYTAFVKTMVQR